MIMEENIILSLLAISSRKGKDQKGLSKMFKNESSKGEEVS